MARILLLDDEEQVRRAIELHLKKQGHSVTAAADGQAGLNLLGLGSFDLIITDLRMPRISGLELLETIRARGLRTPVIVLTAFTSIESAVEAMKLGASDYIAKPPQLDEITIKIENLLKQQALAEENRRLKRELEGRFQLEGIIGCSEAIRRVIEQVKILARDPNISILLTGESGTGKELIARTIHHNSPRAKGPFVAINCGAVPETLLESELFGHERGAFTGAASEKQGLLQVAHRGTLFLDEISTMSAAMQVKLLRALEEKEIRRVGGTRNIPVDIRIVSASNQDLEVLTESNQFRKDLFYRLGAANIALPPLRHRAGDVPLLVDHFLSRYSQEKNKNVAMHPETLAILESYQWPGNIRELGRLIELLVVTVPQGVINPDQLPPKLTASLAAESVEDVGDDLKEATKRMTSRFEREFILRQLEKHRWNVTRTALAIGLSRAALHAKLKEYDIA